ncbi:MAG: putative transcriptional regulator [Promethearchaeota archaeon]|nr:MAG: putative transcriptional regulator [Candidatus Lokiarchaeota archaeon]
MDEINNSEFQKLNGMIKDIREKVRGLVKDHKQKVDHNQERKELELEMFYNNLDFIQKKWSINILWELEIHGGLHFNELMRHLDGISSRSLSDRLKLLKKKGLVSRTVQQSIPPRVLYELKEKGKGFVELSLPMIWYLLITE